MARATAPARATEEGKVMVVRIGYCIGEATDEAWFVLTFADGTEQRYETVKDVSVDEDGNFNVVEVREESR